MFQVEFVFDFFAVGVLVCCFDDFGMADVKLWDDLFLYLSFFYSIFVRTFSLSMFFLLLRKMFVFFF